MTKRNIKDMAASVRARLQTNAKETGRPFQEVLQYFAMERFLFRLSVSPYADRLILKGGLMLTAWRAPSTRPTKDIDLLAMMPNDVKSVVNVVKEICTQKTDTDGLVFDIASVEGRVIKEDAEYEGVRVTFLVYLQNARVNMQIDMGFGDVVIPGPVQLDYPTILGCDSPTITGYTRESTVAEKFEAMVTLGQINSRIRDFFDIWLLSRQFDFEGPVLTRAVRETFANRNTTVRSRPVALTPEYASDTNRMRQWTGFLKKSRVEFASVSLQDVINGISEFIGPIARALESGEDFVLRWNPPGPWK